MMMKKKHAFETNGGRILIAVENIGPQLKMAHEDPKSIAKGKTGLGPGLFFNSDGYIDPNLGHYFHPTMSTNPKSMPALRSLSISVDPSKDLIKLITAHIPGEFWNHMETATMFISHSDSHIIRLKTSQHTCIVLTGDIGVGKSWCVDLCQYYLCGRKK